MKNAVISFMLVLTLFLCSFKKDESPVAITEIKVKAPFVMPDIKVPDFSKCKNFSIVDLGAVQGDKVKTSEAIAKAIDEANKIGVGSVIIPKGEWLTGQIHLKSNPEF